MLCRTQGMPSSLNQECPICAWYSGQGGHTKHHHESRVICVAQVFLEGLAATMKADADFKGGWYDPQRPPTVGPRAFARVYAGWGFSQPFYWEKVWPCVWCY